ncbi:hypothetical protein MTO96_038868, partial [Rhipicephalus appendiculatus]
MGWHTARSRRPAGRRGRNSSPSDSPQTQESSSKPKPIKNVKAQVLKAGRMPPLPKDEIKIILRPKGGLHISKVGNPTHPPPAHNADRYVRLKSIHVNGITHEVNAYEAAPDNTTKGVIRGIPLTDSAQDIDANVVNARNPLALATKRIGTTTTVVIAFDGPSVPYQVRYGATLIPCSLYRKQIDIWAAVPTIPTKTISAPPKCTLCGGPHPTADKECVAKYKTPYVIRKRLWEQKMTQQSTPQASDFPPPRTASTSRDSTPAPEQAVPRRDPGRPEKEDKKSGKARAASLIKAHGDTSGVTFVDGAEYQDGHRFAAATTQGGSLKHAASIVTQNAETAEEVAIALAALDPDCHTI